MEHDLGLLTSSTARQLLGATWIPVLFRWVLTLPTISALAHANSSHTAAPIPEGIGIAWQSPS
jgi:hypothetical protein